MSFRMPAGRPAASSLTAHRGAGAELSHRVLAMVYLAAQLLDGLTTEMALRSGRFREANPLFASVMDSHRGAGIVAKAAIAITVLLIAGRLLAPSRRRAVLGLLTVISLEAPLTNGLRLLGVL